LSPDGLHGVVLDLDDTLTDLASFELELWDDVAKLLAERVPGIDTVELRRRYRDAMDHNFQRLLNGELDIRGYRRARLGQALAPWSELDDDVFDAYSQIKDRLVHDVPPKRGAHDALRVLRDAGLRLAILTNGPSDMQRAKLERLGYLPLVDAVAISAEIGAAKPEPEAFGAVVEMLGVEPGQVAMVGDNWELDVLGALDAGFSAAYYVGVQQTPARDGATRLPSVADLPAALGV
jgi:HAD superfamily hydrolase (TIGR01549 family)